MLGVAPLGTAALGTPGGRVNPQIPAPSIAASATMGTPKVTPVRAKPPQTIAATATVGAEKLSSRFKTPTTIAAAATVGPGRVGLTTYRDLMAGGYVPIAATAVIYGTNHTRPITIATWGDSYTMQAQSGKEWASLPFTSSLSVSYSGSGATATSIVISLTSRSDGLTDRDPTYANKGSSVFTGANPEQLHNGFTSNGLLKDALIALGIPASQIVRREYAVGGTTAGASAGAYNDWLTGIPDPNGDATNQAAWAAGTPLAGTNMWNATYTSFDGDTNGGQSYADFLRTCSGDVLIFGTMGPNNNFAWGKTHALTVKDSYGRPTGFNANEWDAIADNAGSTSTSNAEVVEQALAKIFAWKKQILSVNTNKPNVSFCQAGYLNFPVDESAANTPVVDLPHGTVDNLGGTAYGGAGFGTAYDGQAPALGFSATDSPTPIDRAGFWGAYHRYVHPVFGDNDHWIDWQWAYTKANSGEGTGRWDPEYDAPYHNPANAPTFPWLIPANIISGAFGTSLGWTMDTVGMTKFLLGPGLGTFQGEFYSMSSNNPFTPTGNGFYNIWWSHWTADTQNLAGGQNFSNGVSAIAHNDFSATGYGDWNSAYSALLSSNLDQLYTLWPLWMAVAGTTISNDNVGRSIKGSLDPVYRRLETAQRAAGLDFTYVPTWDILSTGRLGTPIGLGAVTYRSGPRSAFSDSIHSGLAGTRIWVDKILRTWLPHAKAVQGLITSDRLTAPQIRATATITGPNRLRFADVAPQIRATAVVGTPAVNPAIRVLPPQQVRATATMGTPRPQPQVTKSSAPIRAAATMGAPAAQAVVRPTPAQVRATATVGTPRTLAAVTRQTGQIRAQATIGTPTARPAVQSRQGQIAAFAQLLKPPVQTGKLVLAAPIRAYATLTRPTVTSGTKVTPTTGIAGQATIGTPRVGSGIRPTRVAGYATLTAPAAVQSAYLTHQSIAATAAITAPTIRLGQVAHPVTRIVGTATIGGERPEPAVITQVARIAAFAVFLSARVRRTSQLPTPIWHRPNTHHESNLTTTSSAPATWDRPGNFHTWDRDGWT